LALTGLSAVRPPSAAPGLCRIVTVLLFGLLEDIGLLEQTVGRFGKTVYKVTSPSRLTQ
jgi:hypothetical protein